MKVAFLTHYRSLYGANRSLLNLVDGLRTHGVSSHVILPGDGDMLEALQGRGVETALLPIQYWMAERTPDAALGKPLRQHLRRRYAALKRLGLNLSLLPALTRQLKAWRVDIVYTNSGVVPVGAFAARCLRLPHLWHLREFGDLDYGLYPDWGYYVLRRFISATDLAIVISRAIRDHFLLGAAKRRARIIPNGVAWRAEYDRLRERVRGRSPIPNPYTFVLTGLLHPNKGQAEAIEALALVAKDHPRTRLLLVGGGDSSGLKELARSLSMADKVEFRGYLQDPYSAYLEANAALMCSRHEGMGRVTAEAMSASLPVLGYDGGGTSEVIRHAETGLLYLGGPGALALCMKRLIEDPAWAAELGRNGWRIARREYSIETCAASVYRALLSVLPRG